MTVLGDIVRRNRSDGSTGIPAWCTAHPDTLRAILSAHAAGDAPILIEATCNQVNQFGGYTGMTARAFRNFVAGLAREAGVAEARIILGGDHLGPNPWRHESAQEAMAKAADMVRDYVDAGFTKIHLDATMPCADDASLSEEVMASRAAELCAVAERASRPGTLAYVIGNEVPIPGGETSASHRLATTRPEAAQRTYGLYRHAFAARDLTAAFARVIALVVQPGVDFDNRQILVFDPSQAKPLSGALASMGDIAFEAHSTDYQSAGALADLVAANFAVLKVGPELTFAYREAVVAMAAMEDHLPAPTHSNILRVIRDVMQSEPKHWKGYIDEDERFATMQIFGLSDRIRYYWPNPRIQDALAVLRGNIDAAGGETSLISQYAGLPSGYRRGGGALSEQIVRCKVGQVVRKYSEACG